MDKTSNNTVSAPVPEGKRRKKKNTLAPLLSAAKRVSKLICELSADRELFVTEAGQKTDRRLDTKTLKEFSGIIKEMSAVMAELDPTLQSEEPSEIRIEFSDEANELSG